MKNYDHAVSFGFWWGVVMGLFAALTLWDRVGVVSCLVVCACAGLYVSFRGR